MSFEHVSAGVELFKGAGRLAGELFGIHDLNPFDHIAYFDGVDGTQGAGIVELAHHVSSTGADDAPRIRVLGNDPVDKDGFRPSDLENESANPDLKENLHKGVDALKEADPSMSQEKADAIKAAVADPEGWTEKRGSDLTGKKVLMADGDKVGDFGAKKHTLDLAPDTIVYTKEVEYTVNGQTYTETIYVPQDCANVSIDIEADKKVAVVPEEVCAADEWEVARPDTSKGGIDFDKHGPLPRVYEYETWVAPKGVTIDGAEAYIQSAFENDPRFNSIKEGETRHFVLWLNDDCDGVPDHAQCVTVTRIDGKIVVSADTRLDTLPGRGERFFEDMTIEERKAWGGIK